MSDDVPISPFAPLTDLGLTREERRTIAWLLVGLAVAFVAAEWAHLLERRIARRHPLLTEIVEGAAHHPPHRR